MTTGGGREALPPLLQLLRLDSPDVDVASVPGLRRHREGQAMTLPAYVERDVRRILRGACQRVLREQRDGDPIVTAPRRNGHPLDGGADQRSSLVEGEQIPVGAGAERHRGSETG